MQTSRVVVPAAEEIINHYFPVLDHGFVALKDYMGSDATIEESARVSYGQGTRKRSETRHLLRYLYRHGHTSPFEMCSVRLHLGLPVVVMRQLVRQRTAKLNENSGRYSVMPKLFYRADVSRLCKQSRENKQGTGTEPLTEDEIHEYELNREISLQAASCHYDAAMDAGLARETARNELPLSTYTYLYWKIDMRNMFNLLAKRCEDDAQYEYRCYANVFAGIVQRLCPLAFEAFQDYEQGAATFTQAELAALPAYYLAHCHLREPSELTRQFINDILAQGGVAPTKSGKESREQAEFWAKLKPRAKRSYELDPATAKDASFYEKLMEANA